jgi:exonuclease III
MESRVAYAMLRRAHRLLERQFGAHAPGRPSPLRDQPDVLCLQETKVRDELFALDALRRLGF